MKKEKLNLKDALKNLKLTVQYIKPYKGLFILEIIITLISSIFVYKRKFTQKMSK